ncbi:MAG: hypothetical protein QM764_24090 [Chitinophagaceae bacterium]
MKKILFLAAVLTITVATFAQDSTSVRRTTSSKDEKRRQKREKINSMIRQDEEGVLSYHKQSVFGIQLRSLGYGLLYEIGRMKTTRKTTTYAIEISEIKDRKEDKLPKGTFTFGNPYIYGKINNFYQVKLGIGQQYILGEKGNKNGVSVSAVYGAGFSLGLLRPYYIQVQDQAGNVSTIKYEQDTALFTGGLILGGGGLGKGWGEMKIRPGAYGKAGLRFDYGRFNEVVSAIEVGVSLDAYIKEVPIMLYQQDKRLFFQGYIALEFGKRK